MPRRLKGNAPAVLEVRGEVFMDKHGFEKINADRVEQGLAAFANPRKAASWFVEQLDPAIVARRPLGIILYGPEP